MYRPTHYFDRLLRSIHGPPHVHCRADAVPCDYRHRPGPVRGCWHRRLAPGCGNGEAPTSINHTVRQVLKLTEPPECFARLIVLLLYRWAYGLVFLKAAAERVSETKVVGLTQFIPWSSGSWKFGPTPEELAFQALESFSEVGLSAYSDSSLQAASLTILESCVAIYGLKI